MPLFMTLPLKCCIFSCLEIPSNFVTDSEDCLLRKSHDGWCPKATSADLLSDPWAGRHVVPLRTNKGGEGGSSQVHTLGSRQWWSLVHGRWPGCRDSGKAACPFMFQIFSGSQTTNHQCPDDHSCGNSVHRGHGLAQTQGPRPYRKGGVAG